MFLSSSRMNKNRRKLFLAVVILALLFVIPGKKSFGLERESPLFWPPPPAEMRVTFVQSIYSPRDVGIKPTFFKRIKKFISGEERDLLSRPVAVAVDNQGTIYVCDPGVPAVHIFDQKKKQYKTISTVDRQALASPVGVAADPSGLIFISDSKLKKVFCLDKNNRLQFTLGEDNTFLRPTGLTLNDGRLYVVDTAAHCVVIYDLKGRLIGQFGKRGKKEGEFNYPTSITCDKNGNIYVTDTLNFRIQVFDKNNKFLYDIGQLGDSSGSFSRPKGVAVDSFGHVYSTDSLFDNVQIFSSKKEFLLSLGESGHKSGEFWIISGIAIDDKDYIYVADSYNQRLQIFRYIGKE